MIDELVQILESFGFPVMRQGSLPQNQQYHATFITYWNNDEYGQAYYDNTTSSVIYDFAVNVYSTVPNTAYSTLDSIRIALLQNGWTITDRGFDVASDEITHTGRGLETQYMQMLD